MIPWTGELTGVVWDGRALMALVEHEGREFCVSNGLGPEFPPGEHWHEILSGPYDARRGVACRACLRLPDEGLRPNRLQVGAR